MRGRTAWIYEVFYCVAEFGEDHVVIEASSREEADQEIDTWCKNNNCVYSESPSGAGPKPRYLTSGFLVNAIPKKILKSEIREITQPFEESKKDE